ncbi:hypothetical protein GCM10010329_42660 [Streptomyces spiroverticillatus]|uniref:Uncharacterized protein n=1 Tax=Streptomyces finlayi TaxID=67296 RepID=A0A918WZ39_9ACTN|nr:hypothetical protein GCM10010329_42660 [Streptomyces spiroverticillatus]GHC96859.1 hypothetical protein GCM10010334_37580 [Streptomyces finlayi]
MQHGTGAAEGDDDGGQYGGAEHLGTQLRFGSGRRGGTGSRPAVPPALAAVCSRGWCAKMRHQRPRYVGPHGFGVQGPPGLRACVRSGFRGRSRAGLNSGDAGPR